MLLKHLIVNQINNLVQNLPRTDNIDISLRFDSDEKKFEKAIRETFGRFYTQKELKQNVI